MINFCFFAGIILLALFLLWKFSPKVRQYVSDVYYRFTGKELITKDNVDAAVDGSEEKKFETKFEQFSNTDPSGTMHYVGEDKMADGSIKAVILLKPLFQRTGSSRWESKAEQESLLIITDSFWIVNIPRQEGSQRVWLMMDEVSGDYGNLRDFYLSGESGNGEGPARKFKNKNQIVSEPYYFPVQWKLFEGQSFKVVDIGAFEALSANGNTNEKFYNGDFFAFITSKDDKGNWLLLLDPRRVSEDGYMTKGNGSFLIGKEVNSKMLDITPY